MQNYVEVPKNVNRANEYAEFDRGLFMTGIPATPAGRIKEATYTTYGDLTDYGVLRYRVELFTALPVVVGDLVSKSAGVVNEDYFCFTKTMCDTGIMVEAFAINDYLNGHPGYTPAQLQETTAEAVRMVTMLSKEVIQEMITTLEFMATDTHPLTMTTAALSYRAKVGNTTLTGNLTPSLEKVRPLSLTLKDIKDRIAT